MLVLILMMFIVKKDVEVVEELLILFKVILGFL